MTEARLSLTAGDAGAERPSPADLPAFLPYACRQFGAPFCVKVTLRLQETFGSKEDKSKKGKQKLTAVSVTYPHSKEKESLTTEQVGPCIAEGTGVVPVTAIVDTHGQVVGLEWRSCDPPRLLLRVLALCLPYQPHLARLSILHASLSGELVYELGKLLSAHVNLTELWLEDAPAKCGDHAAAVGCATRLSVLVLAGCTLGDAACAELAALLTFPHCVAESLLALSLPCNRISDRGARVLANALRTNRSLVYLNLAGNRITDEGAASIFGSLVEFHLTADEVIAKKRRHITYLKRVREVYNKCFKELSRTFSERGPGEGRRGRSGRRSGTGGTAGGLARRSLMVTQQIVGAFEDPFSDEQTVRRDGYPHCLGNATLCYLNLAHNNLGAGSAERVREVLHYQSAGGPGCGRGGLVRVVLEGAATTPGSADLLAVDSLLHDVLRDRGARSSSPAAPPKRIKSILSTGRHGTAAFA